MPVILVGEFLLALDIVSLNILDSTISRAMEYHWTHVDFYHTLDYLKGKLLYF